MTVPASSPASSTASSTPFHGAGRLAACSAHKAKASALSRPKRASGPVIGVTSAARSLGTVYPVPITGADGSGAGAFAFR